MSFLWFFLKFAWTLDLLTGDSAADGYAQVPALPILLLTWVQAYRTLRLQPTSNKKQQLLR